MCGVGGKKRKQHKKEKAHWRGEGGSMLLEFKGKERKKSKGENWKFLASQQAPLQPSRMHKTHFSYPTDTCLTGVLLG